MSLLRRSFALFCAGIALVGLGIGAWSAAQFRSATHARPWFVAPSGFVLVDGDKLYIAVNDAEVQVYDSEGRPLRAWRLDPTGAFRLGVVGDRLEVAFADSPRVLDYDFEGRLLGERSDPDAWKRLAPSGPRETPDGRRFALTEAGLVRSSPAPSRVLVPLPPEPLRWYGKRPLMPVTATLLLAPLGLIGCVWAARGPRDQGIGPS